MTINRNQVLIFALGTFSPVQTYALSVHTGLVGPHDPGRLFAPLFRNNAQCLDLFAQGVAIDAEDLSGAHLIATCFVEDDSDQGPPPFDGEPSHTDH